MRRKLPFVSLLIVAMLGGTALAQQVPDGETIEVTAPNECCPLPDGLGMLTGWGGAATGAVAGVSLAAAAQKANSKTVKQAKDKAKKQPKAPAEQSVWDQIFGIFGKVKNRAVAWMDLLDKQFSLMFRWEHRTFVQDPATGEWIEVDSTKACAGAAANTANPCAEVRTEQFVDPTDGIEKWVTTIAKVRGVYNPRHVDAGPDGWAPQVIDSSSVFIIYTTRAEFVAELDRLIDL